MSKNQDKKLKVKTWQISFFLAIVVLIFFLLLNSTIFCSWVSKEIPNAYYRTLAVGLLLAVIVFISCGIVHHYICPVKESNKQKIAFSPIGVLQR